MLLSIVSAAILSRYFDKTGYGTYKQILYIYNSFLLIFTAGLPKVFAYFLPRYDKNEGKEIVWRITRLLFGLGFLFAICLFSSAGLIADILKNSELKTGLRYFAAVPIFLLPTLGIEGIFSSYRKTIYIAVYNTLTRIIMLLCITIPVLFISDSYVHAIYGWLAGSFLTLLVALYFKNIPFKNVIRRSTTLKNKTIFSYSLPIVVASIAGIAIKASDQFYISRYFGPDVFAEFANGFIQLPFTGIVTGAAATVLMPRFSTIIHEGDDISQLLILWNSTLEKSALIIYPLLIFSIFYARQIIVILFSDLYLGSVLYFQIVLFLNFFNIILFVPLILALGKSRFYAKIHLLFAFSTWVVGYFAVIIFNSPYFLAVFSVINSILLIICVLLYSCRLLNVSIYEMIPFKKFAVILIHSILGLLLTKFIIASFVHTVSDFASFVCSSLVFAFVMIASSRIFNVNYLSALKPILRKVGL